MAFSLRKLLIIDIEATCWENNISPKNETSEIIEVGISLIDLMKNIILSKESLLIKPVNSKISEYCTKLTTLTQQDVDKGISFSEACDILKNKYFSNKIPWGSWGDYDREIFYKQCNIMKVPYPFSKTHINIKNLYSILNNLPIGLSLKKALMRENLKFDGTPHRGADDAYNIAKLFLILKNNFNKKEVRYEIRTSTKQSSC